MKADARKEVLSALRLCVCHRHDQEESSHYHSNNRDKHYPPQWDSEKAVGVTQRTIGLDGDNTIVGHFHVVDTASIPDLENRFPSTVVVKLVAWRSISFRC